MNWPPVEFILKANRGQHIARVIATISLVQLAVQLAVHTGSSGGQGSVGVHTVSTGDLVWGRTVSMLTPV